MTTIRIVDIIYRNREYDAQNLDLTYKSRNALEPVILPEATKHYTPELCRLVRRCVRYKPEDRISATEVREQIRRFTDPASFGFVEELRYAQGLRYEFNDDNPAY